MKRSSEHSQQLLGSLTQESPTANSWGIATFDFSTGGFWWFKNKQTLITFLDRGLPTLERDPEEIEDFEALLKAYLEQLSRIAEQEPDFAPVAGSYNQYFKSDIEVFWIGNFNELAYGYHPFARHVRETFKENPDPIKKADLKQFKQFLDLDVPDLGLYTR